MIRVIFACFMWVAAATAAVAQDAVWVQVEAQSSLNRAQDRARAYAADQDNVSGYSLGGRWYGIVLGPYARPDAEQLLRDLRRAGRIPRDSFIVNGRGFRQQFWPIGVGAETTVQPLPSQDDATPAAATQVAEAPEAATTAPVETPAAAEVPAIQIPDETRSQAQASEAKLDRAQRKDLQIALQWAGFYTSAIDGAFGRGTRGSMRAWQEANNHETTGILTTGQRAELFAAYNAVLEGMDLQLVRDDASGIEMLIPTGVVAFAEYEPPFVRFNNKGEVEATVLLISQEGDQNRLFGLYEILQTLAIVPPEGDRKRGKNSFELNGVDDKIHSYTYATVADGTIKGFSLIWPAGDDERRRRVLGEMRDSFTTFDGVLDPALATPGEDQAIDLVAGLQVRKPKLTRSGFYIDEAGTVLTTSDVVQGCERISINDAHDADLDHIDADLGIAVLRPQEALAPLNIALFQTGIPRLQSEVAVAGFPYGGILVTPSLTFGRLADLRGLRGEDTIKRLDLTAQDGDVGGPVFDNGGAVLGMLRPREVTNGQVLPPQVSFSLDAETILASLSQAGITAERTDSVAFMPPETLTKRASETTVLVSCW